MALRFLERGQTSTSAWRARPVHECNSWPHGLEPRVGSFEDFRELGHDAALGVHRANRSQGLGGNKMIRYHTVRNGLGKCTHDVPESESALNLNPWRLNTRECLLADLQRHFLRLLYTFRVRVRHALATIEMRERVQIHLSEDAKAGVCVDLEWERQGDVEEIVASLSRISAQ
ncbi:hypothetical protein EXIGLDRAFT_286603 [Exidia glandulosa HHB12029]|uniref:Uncharacterized protein n=1 Tax=Exidia glandulosa HHB12029 TaxID=1314781 RepID=A0A165M5S7_EXIGL|nr:hypothetical protein EXIGLDRAFT_286603 [Exidia glandulosa HHB12029]